MSSVVVEAFTRLANAVNDAHEGDVYSMYGHRKEIANRLLRKDSDKVYKYQKYPLIALNMPFVEQVQHDGMITVRMNVAIMNYTKETYVSESRYEEVFIPILEPLYNLLLDQIVISPDFNNIGVPVHDRVDRLFWGNDQQDSYVFNDPLDAIELLNLELKLLTDNC